MNKKQINKIKLNDYFDNFKDIENFLKDNSKDIKETCLYNSGGGCLIYYILIGDKIYSVSDEIIDNKKSDTIIYKGFNSIDAFLNDDDVYYNYDNLEKEFIKI